MKFKYSDHDLDHLSIRWTYTHKKRMKISHGTGKNIKQKAFFPHKSCSLKLMNSDRHLADEEHLIVFIVSLLI